MAATARRRVHVLRWDAGLAAFESDSILSRYPEVGDGTHPVIRKAAGLWGRQAAARWLAEHSDPMDMLIGEVPIVGNRFSEFVKVIPDELEPALSSEKTAFIYPIPTKEVRGRLEAIRRASFSNPQHPDEAKDAPPETMELAWQMTRAKAIELGLVQQRDVQDKDAYEPTIYRSFFDYLLQHRNALVIDVDRLVPSGRSAHDLDADISELIATPREVETAIAAVEAEGGAEQAIKDVEVWYLV